MTDLLYHSESADPRIAATLVFIFESLGIEARPAPPPTLWERPHLFHGRAASARSNGVAIRIGSDDVFWHPMLEGRLDPTRVDGLADFDVVAAIAMLLGDDLHRDLDPNRLDAHGRLGFASSVPAEVGYGDRPIVNEYVAFIGRMLSSRLGVAGKSRWPAGKVAAIALSHDVDTPDRYALLRSAAKPWRFRRSARSYARGAIGLSRRWIWDRHRDDHWLFDQVAASEADHGFRSTFFFAAVPFHAARGHRLDVSYDVGERRYRQVMARLQAHGFEIGLHASYRAYEREEWMAEERHRLGRLAGTSIRGVRHHYWHLGPDIGATLRSHERAGFHYDSSLAFNDAVGFRRSVALPFHVFDATLERPLKTLEIPTFCMDGNLFYTSDDVDRAVATVGSMIDRIVATGGVGAIDWHIQTSFPGNREFEAWGVAYQEILRGLAGRPDVWVDTLGNVTTWAEARAAHLQRGAGLAAGDEAGVLPAIRSVPAARPDAARPLARGSASHG